MQENTVNNKQKKGSEKQTNGAETVCGGFNFPS